MNVGVHDHPSDESLALFIDGGLPAAGRDEIAGHLAVCAECTDVVLTTRALRQEEPSLAPVVRGRFDAARWMTAAAVMAAAAVLVVLFLSPVRERFLPPRGIEKLVRATGPLEYRRVDARLTGDFAYKPLAAVHRGAASIDARERLLVQAAGELQNAPRRDAESLHALGVSHLLLGRSDAAVQSLQLALSRVGDDADLRGEISSDLAAALIARGTDADLEQALKLSDQLWSSTHSPVAAWNRAVSAEMLGRTDVALRAWGDYLRVDSRSDWAAEAQKRRVKLGVRK